jgi:UPF0755 protein
VKKFIVWLILISLLLLSGITYFAWTKINEIEELTLNLSSTIEFEVPPGISLYKVVNELQKHANINKTGFKLWLKLHPEYQTIKSGLYEIPANSRFVDVIALFAKGTVKQFSITLIEGLTIYQWLEALSNSRGLYHDIDNADALYTQLKVTETSFCANSFASIEGCLLPDTYFYTHGTKTSQILKRSYRAMDTYLQDVWPSRFKDIPIKTAYEALILASIIEKETAIESERSEIAGVFVNRLNKNMRLQTDPTVIYGIGKEFDGNITRKHMRTPTPYNTYVIKGLPITPIAMPNKASIQAALFPALTDSLYFVATGNGGHQFSSNLADHNKALKQYLKQLKLNNADNSN